MASEFFKSPETFVFSMVIGLWLTSVSGFTLYQIYEGADIDPLSPAIVFLLGLTSLGIMVRCIVAEGEGPRNQGSLSDL